MEKNFYYTQDMFKDFLDENNINYKKNASGMPNMKYKLIRELREEHMKMKHIEFLKSMNSSYRKKETLIKSENTSFTSILKILDWQVKFYSKRCKNYTWIATVKKSNKAAIAINRRVGFVDAGNDAYEVLPILFPNTDKDFKVFELQL